MTNLSSAFWQVRYIFGGRPLPFSVCLFPQTAKKMRGWSKCTQHSIWMGALCDVTWDDHWREGGEERGRSKDDDTTPSNRDRQKTGMCSGCLNIKLRSDFFPCFILMFMQWRTVVWSALQHAVTCLDASLRINGEFLANVILYKYRGELRIVCLAKQDQGRQNSKSSEKLLATMCKPFNESLSKVQLYLCKNATDVSCILATKPPILEFPYGGVI